MTKKMLFIFLFLILAVLVLFIAHYLLYDYSVKFFGLKNPGLKRCLLFFFAAMPLLFIVSMVLVRFGDNALSRALYFFSGIWHGMLVNFMAVVFFSWAVVGAMKIINIERTPTLLKVLGMLGVLAALSVSFYGIYNVFNFKISRISAGISGLPSSWQGKKAVHISDVHLGSILRSGYMEKLAEKVNSQKPDIIFITGDLFDGMDGDTDMFAGALKALRAKEGVYYVLGNHDLYVGAGKVLGALEKSGIRIMDDEIVDIGGLQLIGIAYGGDIDKKNVAEAVKHIEGYDPGKASVLLYHEPVQIRALAGIGIDLMLSGHTHKGQMWPFNYITELIYHGYDYGLHRLGNFSLYTSSGAGVWGPTMRTSGHSEIVVVEF